MKEKRRLVIAAILILAAAAAGYYFFVFERARQQALQEVASGSLDVASEAIQATSQGETTVQLFFSNPTVLPPGSEFITEERSIFRTGDPSLKARQVVTELLKGRSADPGPPEKSPTGLRQVYLLNNGTAVVDLTLEFVRTLNGGILAELNLIYSITRSLRENVSGVDQVKFIVDGQERSTLAGHVSIRHPFM